MHKIYSRPRIKIPKVLVKVGKKLDTKHGKKLCKIIIVLIIAFSVATLILEAILPIFDTLCENKAKSVATIISNEQATVVMKNYNYDDLFTIEKNAEGNISMVKSDIITINEIISDIAIKIQNELDNREREDIQIALR